MGPRRTSTPRSPSQRGCKAAFVPRNRGHRAGPVYERLSSDYWIIAKLAATGAHIVGPRVPKCLRGWKRDYGAPEANLVRGHESQTFHTCSAGSTNKDGLTLIETSRILREPDLQAQCLEKRELRRIMKILQERSALPEPNRGRSAQTARTASAASMTCGPPASRSRHQPG
jgi:hypothetical protein